MPDADVRIANGDFEAFDGYRMAAFNFHDAPGTVSLPDTDVKHSGKASLRFENFQAQSHRNARVMQEVKVHPRRCYRVSLWVKTESLEPVQQFRIQVLAGKRALAPKSFRLEPTTDWQRLTLLFNSLDFDMVRLYAGIWGGQSGRFWLDDLTVEEAGPINVLHRPGTPIEVTNDDGSITYQEGRDYAPLVDPDFSFWNVDRPASMLKLLPESRIQDAQQLRVSWYHPMVVNDSQVTVCMGEPEYYGILEHEAELLWKHLRPKRVLLNMDEVRMGGSCEACRGRDMGELVGECVTRQAEILRWLNPDMELYVWSDMFDPNHNAHADYYLVEGDYTGSWEHIPKDLRISVWGGAPREKSLHFFADQGFPTLVACYYDANDLVQVQKWLDLAAQVSGVRGFMYTPWQMKYELLGDFGDLIGQ